MPTYNPTLSYPTLTKKRNEMKLEKRWLPHTSCVNENVFSIIFTHDPGLPIANHKYCFGVNFGLTVDLFRQDSIGSCKCKFR